MNSSRIFYIYVDWTTEEIPRPFYVGKGTKRRTGIIKRNGYWIAVSKKFGWRREIIFGTTDENYAFEIEKLKIKEYNTFELGCKDGSAWGCNLTAGGEGPSGRGGKLSYLHGLKGKDHPRFGVRQSEEFKKKLSESRKGPGNPMFGKTLSTEHRRKQSEATKGKPNKTAFKKGRFQTKGSENSYSKLNESQVKQIKNLLEEGKLFQREIAALFNVSRSTILSIWIGRTWKHVL